MRRVLVLVAIVLNALAYLLSSAQTLQFALSGYSVPGFRAARAFAFAIICLQPLIALVVAAILAVRFKDIWLKRIDVGAPAKLAIARLAQTFGVILLAISYLSLIPYLVIIYGFSTSHRVHVLMYPILEPSLLALVIGYVLFELGRLIDKDR